MMFVLLSLGLAVLNGVVCKTLYDKYKLEPTRQNAITAGIWGACCLSNLVTAGIFLYVG